MKTIKFLLLITIVAVAGFFSTSCKKETTTVNLVVRNWTLESKTVLGVNVTTNCETNSKWNFKADGSYVVNDACNTTKSGIWKLSADGKTLTLDNNDNYQIIENTPLKLVIEKQVGETGLVRWIFN